MNILSPSSPEKQKPELEVLVADNPINVLQKLDPKIQVLPSRYKHNFTLDEFDHIENPRMRNVLRAFVEFLDNPIIQDGFPGGNAGTEQRHAFRDRLEGIDQDVFEFYQSNKLRNNTLSPVSLQTQFAIQTLPDMSDEVRAQLQKVYVQAQQAIETIEPVARIEEIKQLEDYLVETMELLQSEELQAAA